MLFAFERWMKPLELALIITAAGCVDAWLGDPPAWPHLVRYVGWLIARLGHLLRGRKQSPGAQIAAGGMLWLAVIGLSCLPVWLLLELCRAIWPPLGWLAGLAVAFQCLAAGQLWREARAVSLPLKAGNLDQARKKLSMIVGRDTSGLDETGIYRALIETLAENFNDGVAAPLFYMAFLGPLGGVAYKAVNTLDSMVGYKNEQYLYFGRIPARIDDAAGYLPARVSALILVAAAWMLGLDWRRAWKVLIEDHGAHSSPNAAWPEAAMAGALNARLGGPNVYFGKLVQKPWIGQAGQDPAAAHFKAALNLMALGSAISLILAALLAMLLWAF